MADNLDAYKFKQKTEDGEVGRTIKVGIIGTGWIAGDHAECYKRCPGAEIVALADIVPGKAEAPKKVNLIIRDEVHWYGRKVCGYKD